MKPSLDDFAVVTATLDPRVAEACLLSWRAQANYQWPLYVVWGNVSQWYGESANAAMEKKARLEATRVICGPRLGHEVHLLNYNGGGSVPSMNVGVQQAAKDGAKVICCLHDDLLIEEAGWDQDSYMGAQQERFAGFGGARGLGADGLYDRPYDPMSLARQHFLSNLRDAELHGFRSIRPQACVCFDGFSQIGTTDWFAPAWQTLVDLGFRHHWYDGALGCLARRAGIPYGLMIPVKCHHFGGRTAVANPYYQRWAQEQVPTGDQGFWDEAHRIGYEQFRAELPLRLP